MEAVHLSPPRVPLTCQLCCVCPLLVLILAATVSEGEGARSLRIRLGLRTPSSGVTFFRTDLPCRLAGGLVSASEWPSPAGNGSACGKPRVGASHWKRNLNHSCCDPGVGQGVLARAPAVTGGTAFPADRIVLPQRVTPASTGTDLAQLVDLGLL